MGGPRGLPALKSLSCELIAGDQPTLSSGQIEQGWIRAGDTHDPRCLREVVPDGSCEWHPIPILTLLDDPVIDRQHGDADDKPQAEHQLGLPAGSRWLPALPSQSDQWRAEQQQRQLVVLMNRAGTHGGDRAEQQPHHSADSDLSPASAPALLKAEQ